MSTPFQNRLVGTVIFAAAAVIFLPDLLDGKKQAYQADFEDIPTAPKVIAAPPVKKLPEENFASISTGNIDPEKALNDVFENQKYNQTNAQKQSIISSQENTIDTTLSTTKLKINTLTKEKPFDASSQITAIKVEKNTVKTELTKEIKPAEQWVVQLGSFRHEKNVNVLVDKLKKKNFKVKTKPIKTKNGTLTKVYIGPELSKKALEAQLGDIKSLTGVNGRISKY